MIGRDFSCEAKRDGAELDGRLYYRISTAIHLTTVRGHSSDIGCPHQKHKDRALPSSPLVCGLVTGIRQLALSRVYKQSTNSLDSDSTVLCTRNYNYKHGNKLVWLCFAPAAGVMCVTAYPITSLWYYLYIGIAGQPFTTSITGAIGIASVNTAIGIVIPMLICIHLLRSRRHAL